MAGLFNESLIPIIIVMMIMFIAGSLIMRLIYGSRPKVQPMTKNQFERLLADRTTSAKLNRNRAQKWINITGDSTHPEIKHYAKIIGVNADGRMAEILWRVKWHTPKRLNFIPWELIDNWDGKEVWINCNGTQKDGYFFRALMSIDNIRGLGKSMEYFDSMYLEYVAYLLKFQATQDMLEQGAYETITAASHKERPLDQIFTKPEYLSYDESEQDIPVEPEG